MEVDEYIEAEFPSYDQNHGILRAIPNKYDSTDLFLNIYSVDHSKSPTQPNNTAWNYTSYNENDNQVLKIGNADSYVHGVQNYHIKYSLGNFFKSYPSKQNAEYDEIYWDINGTEWEQTFGRISAKIVLPLSLGNSIKEKACYTGVFGSEEQA